MKHNSKECYKPCNCRSVGECYCNITAEIEALEACVKHFESSMRNKLNFEYVQGKSGWDDPDWTIEQIKERIREQLDKGNFINIANFAMFAWNKEPK